MDNQPLVRVTKDQIKEFMNSMLWKDMKRELGLWRKLCRKEYTQVVGDGIESSISSSKVLMHLGSLYGRELAIDFLLSLPDMFLQILEEKEDES